jgi:hypothetical protein
LSEPSFSLALEVEVLLEEEELDNEWLLDEAESEEDERSTLSDLSRSGSCGTMKDNVSSVITCLFDTRGVAISSADEGSGAGERLPETLSLSPPLLLL